MAYETGASSFIKEFHCIDGLTIRDRQHNVYQLFRKYSKLNSDELYTICFNLKPKTHLEKIFRIDFLIYFKRIEELYKEFQNGDEITTCKVAKHDWFFKQSFEKYSADEFVNSVLPTMSYSTRIKILKRFNGNTEQNDAIFDALKKRYGLFKSSVWLTKCSAEKIKEILEKYPNFRLTENQLKAVFEKDKNLIMFYYERFECGSDFKHKSLLALIAKKDPGMLLELLKRHKNFCKGINLGRRNTRHFIATNKKAILEEPEEFFQLLNLSALRRKLGADSIVIVEKLFPAKIDDIVVFYETRKFLMHYPPKIRSETFKAVYNKRFSEQFEDNPNAINIDILKDFIYDKFEREKYALIKYKQKQDVNFLEYITPETCFTEFTTKMSKMGVEQRAKFIAVLTKCCIINRDLETLLKVCELVTKYFKNDDQLNSSFIIAMNDIRIINILNEEHFKHIFEIFANDTNNITYFRNALYFAYLECLHRNNKPLKEALFQFPTELEQLYITYIKDTKLFKKILLELLTSPVPKELETIDSTVHVSYVTPYERCLTQGCVNYSQKHPIDKIFLLDYEITRNAMHNILKDDWGFWGHREYIEYVIKNSTPNAEFIKFVEAIFNEMKTPANARIVISMLKKYPKLVEKHIDQFLVKFKQAKFNNTTALWRLIKKFSHLELDKRVVDFCVMKLNLEEAVDGREDYIRPLSILIEPKSYRNFIQRFIPKEEVNLEDQEQKEKCLIQSQIAWSLSHFEHPTSVLPLVLQFCKGSKLKYALRSLYTNVFRLQEDKIEEFIEKLNQVDAISVKKHGLYLCCEICDEKTILQMLKMSSLPILLPCIRYLHKNPSEECWELVESKLSKLTIAEKPPFQKILKLGVPQEFIGRFFEIMWKVFVNCNIKKYNSSLLKKLDKKTIKLVSESFTNDLFLNHLFETGEIDDFLVLHLLHNDETNWYENFLRSLENIKEKHEKEYPVKIKNLIKKFYTEYLNERNDTNLEFITKFGDDFKRIFAIDQFFEEYIILELIKQKGERIGNIAEFIIAFQLELVNKYGELIINQFHGILYAVINLIVTDKEHLNFCTEVLNRAQDKTDYLLVISLLPKQVPGDFAKYSKYTAIVNSLKSVDNLVVKLSLDSSIQFLKCYSKL